MYLMFFCVFCWDLRAYKRMPMIKGAADIERFNAHSRTAGININDKQMARLRDRVWFRERAGGSLTTLFRGFAPASRVYVPTCNEGLNCR